MARACIRLNGPQEAKRLTIEALHVGSIAACSPETQLTRETGMLQWFVLARGVLEVTATSSRMPMVCIAGRDRPCLEVNDIPSAIRLDASVERVGIGQNRQGRPMVVPPA
jgi:hypothetical protein